MKASPLMALRARAEAELSARYPEVIGVGIGLKETDGKTTGRRALRIYVRKKKKPSELSEEEMLPREFEDMPTDVLELIEKVPLHCEDTREHAVLIGGISISTLVQNSEGGYDAGTLGFFATLDGVEGPDNVVLVSNNHVLAGSGETEGQRVYNPVHVEALDPDNPEGGQTTLRADSKSRPIIGKINNVGLDGGHSFDYGDGDGEQTYYLDAATAKLDIRISSTCNKSTGVEYANRIRDLKLNVTGDNPDGNSRIADIARLRAEDVAPDEDTDTDPSNDYVVFKVGARTSKTRGKVVEVMMPASVDPDDGSEFMIEVLGTDCDGFDRFAAHGDSGAAIINSDNELIGILHSVSDGDGGRFGFACHIHPVMDFFGITPISEQNEPVGPAGVARSGTIGALMPREENVLLLRRKIETNARAGPLYNAFMEHWNEIVWLVNNRRPLLVAWHRSKGPAYVAHLSESARRPGHRIPYEIDGVGRGDLLMRMADLLRGAGSQELRAFVDAHLDMALALAAEIDDLHGFVDKFERDTADA